MEVTVKNAVFWNVMLWASCNNRYFRGTRVLRFLVTANIVPSLPILVTLMMEAMFQFIITLPTIWCYIILATKSTILYIYIYIYIYVYIYIYIWNAGQNQEIKIGNRSFENVSQFRYLGTTVTNQNLIQEEIKKRLNSGNAFYHSVQNLLSSRLL
jgi:hypothetical protein